MASGPLIAAMGLRFIHDQVRRLMSRGWRAVLPALLGSVLILAFLTLMMSDQNEADVIRVIHNDRIKSEEPITHEVAIISWINTDVKGASVTALTEVLDNIIADAALQFRPDGKDVKDLDVGHLARQTAVLGDLLRIYERISPSTRELQQERTAFQQTIETLQQTLYPWITKPKDGNATYASFFNLIDSFQQDAGIVISAGKDGGFRWAIHQIATIRAVLNSTLPIELFYGGDSDLPPTYQEFIESINDAFPDAEPIRAIDITQKFPDPDGILDLPGGWAMRPFAMLASSFKRVILADADTIFLQDPRVLLYEPTFEEYGAVFWHDRLLAPASEETYKWADEILEIAKAKNLDKQQDQGWFRHQTFYELERYIQHVEITNCSGALIIDKTRNLAGLLMTCHLNSKHVRDTITYRRFYGDKESYWFAHALTSTPYHFVPGYSGGIGRLSHEMENGHPNLDKEQICTLQLLHVLESTGEPFWFNNAITEYKGANDAHYIVPEAWVPHNGRWHGGATRFPNEFCVDMPQSQRDRLVGLPERVNRIEGDLKERLNKMIEVVREYDELMERADLISISR